MSIRSRYTFEVIRRSDMNSSILKHNVCYLSKGLFTLIDFWIVAHFVKVGRLGPLGPDVGKHELEQSGSGRRSRALNARNNRHSCQSRASALRLHLPIQQHTHRISRLTHVFSQISCHSLSQNQLHHLARDINTITMPPVRKYCFTHLTTHHTHLY